MTSVPVRDRRGRDTDARRRRPGDGRGRDWSDVATSQGPPGAMRNGQRQEGPSPGAHRGSRPCNTLVSDSRTVREHLCSPMSPSLRVALRALGQEPSQCLGTHIRPLHGRRRPPLDVSVALLQDVPHKGSRIQCWENSLPPGRTDKLRLIRQQLHKASPVQASRKFRAKCLVTVMTEPPTPLSLIAGFLASPRVYGTPPSPPWLF